MEHKAEKEHLPTKRGMIREDVDAAIAQSQTYQQFLSCLQRMGYEVNIRGKYHKIRPIGDERFFRLRSLDHNEGAYTQEAIIQQILANKAPAKPSKRPQRKTLRVRPYPVLHGLQATWFIYIFAAGPRRKSRPRSRHTVVLRKDAQRLRQRAAMCTLLFQRKITTLSQLAEYQLSLQQQSKKQSSQYRRTWEEKQREAISSAIAGKFVIKGVVIGSGKLTKLASQKIKAVAGKDPYFIKKVGRCKREALSPSLLYLRNA